MFLRELESFVAIKLPVLLTNTVCKHVGTLAEV